MATVPIRDRFEDEDGQAARRHSEPNPDIASLHSTTDEGSSYSGLEKDKPLPKAPLLELCDQVRHSLRVAHTLGRHARHVTAILEHLAALEDQDIPSMDLKTLKYTRADKLLADLIEHAEHRSDLDPNPLGQVVEVARSLMRAWQARFQEDWFALDEIRLKSICREGRLKNVDYCETSSDILERWKAKSCPCAPAPDGEFEPGNWWLNLACAHRDGIVGSAFERPTKGRYGIQALPLITGREEALGGSRYKYIREGKTADMHFALLSRVGSQTRILRGFRLKSVLAPSAGVRYDGLYYIRMYSTKLDPVTNMHRLELMLERLPGQIPEEDLRFFPWPSQLDDWHLFEKHEAEIVKRRSGDRGFLAWKTLREEEKIDRVH